jgi:hypothetical protein
VRDPGRGIAALVLASLGLLAVACNRRPAEDALAVADQALATARPELERYAPDQLDSLAASARQARALLDGGHYTDALKTAMGLPSRIQAALAVAAAKREQLLAAWADISARLPAKLDGLAARADVASLSRGWTEATAAFQEGDVPGAVRRARDVEAKAGALAAMLGLAAAPATPEPRSSRPDIIGPSGPGPGSNP